MTLIDKTAQSQTESLSFEFDLSHSPEMMGGKLLELLGRIP
jgi:hypothetical protein